MTEIPQLLDGRVDYFGVCLLALIKALVSLVSYCALIIPPLLPKSLYYNECSSSMQSCLKGLRSDSTSQDFDGVRSEESIRQTTATHLASIKTLSIVGNSQPHS